MRIYLAGGVSGNLYPYWKRLVAEEKSGKQEAEARETAMKIFLAGGESRHWVHETTVQNRPYILESFYYSNEDTELLIPKFGDFLLDSGAFTFMVGNHKGSIDWVEYIKRYSEFIRKNKVQKFFELDIDSVVGYEEVKKLRKVLEYETGRQCIPVWHKYRGIEEYKRMCDEYKYVAIGGIVSGEIKPEQYNVFPVLLKEAHKKGVKVHGLGFTSLSWLRKCHFDSVDSTAWTTGNRFGFIYKFNGETMEKIKAPKGSRLSSPREVALINFTEWVKFQKYAEDHL